MRFFQKAVLGVLSLWSVCASAEVSGPSQQRPISVPKDGPFDASFDAFVEATLREFRVPGLSIAVVDDGHTYSKGFGFATLEPRRNATADTQYFTGSTTKAFTAAAAAMLVHDDQNYPEIKWNSRINHFIREDFVLEDEYATNHITLEDALSHRSGLPRHDLMYGQKGDTLRSVVQRMRYLPMTTEPRTRWQYCNLMFAVVTDFIEAITGRGLESILRENFWEPLGMASTTWTLPANAAEPDSRLARGYYWDPHACEENKSMCEGQYVPDPYVDISAISGAGATISTVNDYALWIRAWLQAVRGANASSPVNQRIFHDLLTPRSIISEELTQTGTNKSEFITPPLYGLAWINIDLLNEPLVSHGGAVTGFGTELFMLPDRNFGVVTMANTQDTSNLVGALIASHLLVKKLGQGTANIATLLSALERLPKPHLRQSLFRTREKTSESMLYVPTAHGERGAPQHPVTRFAGMYSHPAYGQINLTVASSQKDLGQELQGLLYPRMWPVKLRLVPKVGSVFAVHLLDPHGLGDVPSGKGIVWEEIGESEAVFEFQPDQDVVRTMGIALDGDMVTTAMEKGPEHWREAMVWFEKV